MKPLVWRDDLRGKVSDWLGAPLCDTFENCNAYAWLDDKTGKAQIRKNDGATYHDEVLWEKVDVSFVPEDKRRAYVETLVRLEGLKLEE